MAKPTTTELEALNVIARRILWLATRMVDSANNDRPNRDGVKVGGHQASSASTVGILTALWFHYLGAEDRVAVKPHASPVFHAIQYLLGNLDKSYLTRLRDFGGLQAYPSRTKDPEKIDFSTGSVGLGAAAPLFAAVVRRYVDEHFGARPYSRFISVIGDAELDEGNVWEAVAEGATQGLGNVLWIVDFNRQSLDRVVPGIRIDQWRTQFNAAGWNVKEVKYGRKLHAQFAKEHGPALRGWIDEMPNEMYQSLFGLEGPELRERFCENAPQGVISMLSELDDAAFRELVTDLGGHDIPTLLEALDECDLIEDRPTVIFAYTVKGWGLPIAGNPRNHSALLSSDQIDLLRQMSGLDASNEWERFSPESAEGKLCKLREEAMRRTPHLPPASISIPTETISTSPSRTISTQETFGRVLVNLSRISEVSPYIVSTAPDVATSTNLAGFINRVGVFSPEERRSWSIDPVLRWDEGPGGQHIELGISEMNLFLLLGQLGLAWDLSGQPLIGIGTVYDPFVLRGLDAFIYSVYSGARFLVAGTPSGISLAPEGGAHQSTITPSVGLELPGVIYVEPAYAVALDWLMCDAVASLGSNNASGNMISEELSSFYFRLSTRPIDQSAFEAARGRIGDPVIRKQVLSGAYRLHDALAGQANNLHRPNVPVVNIVATGAMIPEALAASAELASEGVAAHVVDVTSSDRLFREWQRAIHQGIRTASAPSLPGSLRAAFPLGGPVVSLHDASSHHLAWIGSALGVPAISLGVDTFGQSGDITDLYAAHNLTSDSVVNAALSVLSIR